MRNFSVATAVSSVSIFASAVIGARMNAHDVAEKPLQHVDVMAGLIGEHAAVIGPGAAPVVLIVVGLVAAPAHAHGAEDEPAEAAGLQRLARLDHRNVEAVLLDDEQLDARLVAGADHVVGILQPQRHRLFDDDVLAGPGAGDDMLGMHSARRQHRDRVDVLPRQKIIDVVMRRNAELRRDGIGARANGIADGDETGPIDMIAAQQIGVTLRDASASEQAKSDHQDFPVSRDYLADRPGERVARQTACSTRVLY